MEKIELGTTGRKTTRLGFGCSSLMGAMGRKQSLATLEAAFDAGVRHFDVAPMYGFGQAESCLGDFLKRHRADVTITTKYGIPPARQQRLIGLARSVARPVLSALPGLKNQLTRVASKVAEPTQKASFTATQAGESLHRSLAELRTDRIDIWLLHDVELADLQDDGLLRMMEDSIASGIIGAFGVGSERAKVEKLATAQPAYCSVVQFEWSVMDAPVTGIAGFRLHHRSLAHNFRSLQEKLKKDQPTTDRWSRELGMDIGNGEVLASLMLKAAILENPESVIVISSKNPKHIRNNVTVAEDALLETPARRLYQIVRRDIEMSQDASLRVAG